MMSLRALRWFLPVGQIAVASNCRPSFENRNQVPSPYRPAPLFPLAGEREEENGRSGEGFATTLNLSCGTVGNAKKGTLRSIELQLGIGGRGFGRPSHSHRGCWYEK